MASKTRATRRSKKRSSGGNLEQADVGPQQDELTPTQQKYIPVFGKSSLKTSQMKTSDDEKQPTEPLMKKLKNDEVHSPSSSSQYGTDHENTCNKNSPAKHQQEIETNRDGKALSQSERRDEYINEQQNKSESAVTIGSSDLTSQNIKLLIENDGVITNSNENATRNTNDIEKTNNVGQDCCILLSTANSTKPTIPICAAATVQEQDEDLDESIVEKQDITDRSNLPDSSDVTKNYEEMETALEKSQDNHTKNEADKTAKSMIDYKADEKTEPNNVLENMPTNGTNSLSAGEQNSITPKATNIELNITLEKAKTIEKDGSNPDIIIDVRDTKLGLMNGHLQDGDEMLKSSNDVPPSTVSFKHEFDNHKTDSIVTSCAANAGLNPPVVEIKNNTRNIIKQQENEGDVTSSQAEKLINCDAVKGTEVMDNTKHSNGNRDKKAATETATVSVVPKKMTEQLNETVDANCTSEPMTKESLIRSHSNEDIDMKEDCMTDSQLFMFGEDFTTIPTRERLVEEEEVQLTLPPQKSFKEYLSQGSIIMKGLIDELSSINKLVAAMKRHIDVTKKQRQSRISTIWK